MATARLKMRLTTRTLAEPSPLKARTPDMGDVEAFGALLLDAYKGTVDDEGETLEEAVEEARKSLGGEYGSVLPEASFVIAKGTGLQAISLVVEGETGPLLAFVAAAKASQRRGLGTGLIEASLDALARSGRQSLDLFVTATNTPAIRVYKRLGFQEVKAS